jgi:hypothetical protein
MNWCPLFSTPSPHIYRQGTSASPPHSCAPHAPLGYSSVLWKVLEAVEERTGQKPDTRWVNRRWIDRWAAESSVSGPKLVQQRGRPGQTRKKYCVSAAHRGDGARRLVALWDWTQGARVPRGSPAAPAAARTRLRFSALVRLGAAPARDLFLGSVWDILT